MGRSVSGSARGGLGSARARVRPGRRPGVWEVVVDREAAGDAIQAIATSGVELLELHRASEELDEIYHRYFQEVNSHAG